MADGEREMEVDEALAAAIELSLQGTTPAAPGENPAPPPPPPAASPFAPPPAAAAVESPPEDVAALVGMGFPEQVAPSSDPPCCSGCVVGLGRTEVACPARWRERRC